MRWRLLASTWLIATISLAIPPKHEMRGAWFTTVVNLDWPSSRTASPADQEAELVRMFDQLRELGINAVFFQVRAEADALYPSTLEPWSYWLTNEQGRAPQPLWDPLAVAIREARKRGMELHAWMNPYRAHRDLRTYPWAETHPGRLHPEWIMVFRSQAAHYAMLNPGLPDVRDHIAAVVADLVRRYAVDGVHFDDYFYPYEPKITTEDRAAFRRYGRGFANVHDWRRHNVDEMVRQVRDSIKAIDPLVKFGISPFGIRLNSDAGTRGSEGYHNLYADAVSWLDKGYLDYITPQLYWETAHNLAPYEPLLRWWNRTAKEHGRHLYVGMAPYRPWPASEIGRQYRLNRRDDIRAEGVIHFRTRSLLEHTGGLRDSLRTRLHPFPALPPFMPWLYAHITDPVEGLLADRNPERQVRLTWEPVEGAVRYAVYRYPAGQMPSDPTVPPPADRLIAVTGETRFLDSGLDARLPYVYLVTAVNRNNQESTARAVYVE